MRLERVRDIEEFFTRWKEELDTNVLSFEQYKIGKSMEQELEEPVNSSSVEL